MPFLICFQEVLVFFLPARLRGAGIDCKLRVEAKILQPESSVLEISEKKVSTLSTDGIRTMNRTACLTIHNNYIQLFHLFF